MEIKVICGSCGEVLKASPEVKSGEIIINLNEDHSCRTFGSRNNAETLARIEELKETIDQLKEKYQCCDS